MKPEQLAEALGNAIQVDRLKHAAVRGATAEMTGKRAIGHQMSISNATLRINGPHAQQVALEARARMGKGAVRAVKDEL